VSRVTADPVDAEWWKLFQDPELTSLEDRVAAANLDVRLATIRLAESRAQLGVARADEFPTVDGNGSYSREKLSDKGAISLLSGGGGGGGGTVNTQLNGAGGTSGAIPTTAVPSAGSIPPFNLYQYGFDASWELDLWGRVRRSVESADASLSASAEARRDSLLSSLAEVARDYMQLRGEQTQLRIARENLETERQSLELTRERAAGGLTTDLDVANASAQVRSTSAQIPMLEEQEARSINALSLLLGEAPRALHDELAEPRGAPPPPPSVPAGLPSELARRRPDVRQAEAQLHSATADIGVAVAAFYPSVTLSGSFSLQALQFKDVGNWAARQYSLGPSISLPIFEGGRLKATLELRKAQQQEAYLRYQQTVLNAWHEVDDALTAYDREQRRRDLLAAAVDDNRRAVAVATDRYRQGLTEFLQVLDAQRSLLAAQQTLSDSATSVSADLVALYKALGGGWERDYPEQAAAEKQASR
jgi:NodT family efflux transporter outer membrane factor (OMF) lipoprotein